MDLCETFEHAGCKICIYYDPEPFDPRDEYDHLGTMVCFHSRYKLGDKDGEEKCRSNLEANWYDEPSTLYEKVVERGFIVLPLFLYDHSGITMNTTGFSCPWDSGQVGFIYSTDEACTVEMLRAEVEEYDQYLTGQVYGYVVKRGDEEESCWEIYDLKYAEQEARAIAESMEQQHRVARMQRLRTMILNHVPLNKRWSNA